MRSNANVVTVLLATDPHGDDDDDEKERCSNGKKKLLNLFPLSAQ